MNDPKNGSPNELSAFGLAQLLFRQGRTGLSFETETAWTWVLWGAILYGLKVLNPASFEIFVGIFSLYCWLLLPIGFASTLALGLRDGRKSNFIGEMLLAPISARGVLGAYYAAAFALSVRIALPGIVLSALIGMTDGFSHMLPLAGSIEHAYHFGRSFAILGHVVASCAAAVLMFEAGLRERWDFGKMMASAILAIVAAHAFAGSAAAFLTMFYSKGGASPWIVWGSLAGMEILFGAVMAWAVSSEMANPVEPSALAEA